MGSIPWVISRGEWSSKCSYCLLVSSQYPTLYVIERVAATTDDVTGIVVVLERGWEEGRGKGGKKVERSEERQGEMEAEGGGG